MKKEASLLQFFAFSARFVGRVTVWPFLALMLLATLCLGLWSVLGNAQVPVPTVENAIKELVNPSPVKSNKSEKCRFVAMGDWGAGSPMQFDVAKQLADTLKSRPYKVVLLLGDNIYPDGNIRKFADAYFNKPYKPLLDAGVKFYAALGNHDVLTTHGPAQVKFFNMPGRYYRKSLGSADFFILDTNTFHQQTEQQAWLKKALRESTAEWKIVIGHHPLYTSGEHQNEVLIAKLRKQLEPILATQDVDLYLAGHDHGYERFRPVNGVNYIVSGGGGAYLRDFEKILPGSLERRKANHFVLFTLDKQAGKDTLQFEAIDKTGKVIDSGRIEPNPAEFRKKELEKPAA